MKVSKTKQVIQMMAAFAIAAIVGVLIGQGLWDIIHWWIHR